MVYILHSPLLFIVSNSKELGKQKLIDRIQKFLQARFESDMGSKQQHPEASGNWILERDEYAAWKEVKGEMLWFFSDSEFRIPCTSVQVV